MKLKFLIVVFILPFFLHIIAGCGICDCDEEINKDTKITNCSLSLSNLEFGENRFRILTSNTKILKTKFGLRIEVNRKKDVCLHYNTSAFVGSLMACDCQEPLFFAIDTIKSITIKSLNNFDVSHPANSDITNYFSFLEATRDISIMEFISTMNQENISRLGSLIDIKLNTFPQTNEAQQFEIEMKISDGRTIKQKTTVVELI